MPHARKPTCSAGPGPLPGDDPSGDTALKALHGRLVRVAVKLIWNRDDAEDTVQEAFRLALTKGIQTSEGRFAPWMFRTVGNLCLNHRRRRRPEPLADWIDPPHDATPEAAARQAEQLERLREAIERLPGQRRMAPVLRTMEQMAYADIAGIMQLSISAVRAHVHLARRQLAATLGVHEEQEP